MAKPRRCGGNQPMTTRPLAALVLAAAIPPSNRNPPMTTYALERAAPAAATAVISSPLTSTRRSPIRSTRAPQAMRVRTNPSVGIATSTPALARLRWRPSCSTGMRNAAPLAYSALAPCAAMLTASITQRRRELGSRSG